MFFLYLIPFVIWNKLTRRTRLHTPTIIVPITSEDGKPTTYFKNKLKKYDLKVGYNERYDILTCTSKNGWQNGKLFYDTMDIIFKKRSKENILLLLLDQWSTFTEEEAHKILLDKFIYE